MSGRSRYQHPDDAAHEPVSANMAQMSVADQRRHPAAPGFRQIRQLDRDSFHPCPGGIDDATETCQQRQTKQRSDEHLPIRALAEKTGSALNCPTGASRQKAKTQDPSQTAERV